MGIAEIATIIILIISIILHEVAHGYAANALGDPTARLAGRLNINPINHIDPLGSVILPAFLFLSGAPFLFGWAKPVPYNPYNLRNQRWGEALVALAGPATNFLLALIFVVLMHLSGPLGLSYAFLDLASYIVFINVLLGFFNLIPFPPLDGSKVIVPFLPRAFAYRYRELGNRLDQMGAMGSILVLAVFMFVLSGPFFFFVHSIVNALISF
jgi:Zn-dependent protease